MKKPKVVILNITHGDNPYMDQPPFLPIAAGACRHDITTDADGEDNISAKNKWYGDFTSIYWAWKNLKDVDIIGTSHYRRYLADSDWLSKWGNEYPLSWASFYTRKYQVWKLTRLLRKCDFVMLHALQLDRTVREQYIQCHPFPENIDYVTEVLQKVHPESVITWLQILEEKSIQLGYLFITRRERLEELCEWLYPVLVELEKRIDISKYEGYQSRVIAFLYERLVPVFIRTKGYKIEQRSCYFIESSSMFSVKDYKKLYTRYCRSQCKRKIKEIIKKIVLLSSDSFLYRLGKYLLKPFRWMKRARSK